MRYISQTIVQTAIALLVLAGLSMPLLADDGAQTRAARSISYVASTQADDASRKTELDNTAADVLPVLITEGYRTEPLPTALLVDNISYHYGGDITIFDAFTTLISDFDGDGFYHRFSVAIDADTVYSTSWVFAELFLSYEGGPWNYYATSDDFHIHGDSELDIYVVETELAEGFPAGYYDIMIDLYDAETDEHLQSYGPYDDDSLSALPLEDSVYDDVYYSSGVTTEVIVAGHGGLGGWFVTAFVLLLLLRTTANRKQ